MTVEKLKKKIPFAFVLEELSGLSPYTKPMFGCLAIYVEEKIIFILRERVDFTSDNGVWVATTQEHHASLRRQLPSMRSIEVFGPGPTGWQVIPSDSNSFEQEVFRAIEMVIRGDPRIGKIPKKRSPKKKPKPKKRVQAPSTSRLKKKIRPSSKNSKKK